jgi:hypothetical protein
MQIQAAGGRYWQHKTVAYGVFAWTDKTVQ